MGRIVVTEFVSIDGVMEAPGGEEGYKHTGWTIEFPDEGQYEYKAWELEDAEANLLGRVSYDAWAAVWPGQADDPDMGVFARRLNEMSKYVVSTTLEEASWENTTILRSLDEVGGIKGEIEGNILAAGSGTLVHGLLERDLVDELRLMIFPVILGSGMRVFPELEDKLVWELADHRTYGSVVVHVYRRPGR